MADGTKIEWTDATWNIITGCSVVSPGCTNCYAMQLAGTRLRTHKSRRGLTLLSKHGKPVWTGEVRFNEEWLTQPLKWRRPRRIFVCAHGDLFHENVPDEWLDRIFAVMQSASWHTFQALTKRPDRMRTYLTGLLAEADGDNPEWFRRGFNWPISALLPSGKPYTPFRNVWLGVSVEDQVRANERIPLLLDTPASVRWISAEPLLGPVDLTRICLVPKLPGSHRAGVHVDALAGRFFESGLPYRMLDALGGTVADINGDNTVENITPTAGEYTAWPGSRLDWVVVGGESGRDARPMHPDWARSLRDQCAAAGVAFHFKQWGAYQPMDPGGWTGPDALWRNVDRDGTADPFDDAYPPPGSAAMFMVGKKAAGRILDGRTHDEWPEDVRGRK